MHPIQTQIEGRLAEAAPDVEVLLAEVSGDDRCGCSSTTPTASRSTSASASPTSWPELRERYALEVSSPGLRAPADQARPLPPLPRPPRPCPHARQARDGHRVDFTGELVGATESEVTLAADDGVVAIPYGDITRSNLVEE